MGTETLPAVQAMREAAETARNDEILETAIFLHDLMVDRCENAVDMAIGADDRDAMNEASVLIRRVSTLTPSWLGARNNKASISTYYRLLDVEKELDLEISASRKGSLGPAPSKGRMRTRRATVNEPKKVAVPPFTDDELVKALEVACSDWRDYRIEMGQEPEGADRGVWSSCVASALAGGHPMGKDGKHVRHGDVIRVGQRLGKLMREGRIVCVSKPYEHRQYVPAASVDA